MKYEILGGDGGDDQHDDLTADISDPDDGTPAPPRRRPGRAPTLVIALLAVLVTAGLVAAAVTVGSSGQSSPVAPSPSASPTPSLTLFDAPTSGSDDPAGTLQLGRVCEPELDTGDTRSQDRLSVSFELVNGRDIPVQLVSVTPQLSRRGVVQPYRVRAGGRCSDVGDELVGRRLTSGGGVLITLRFRLLDRCPNPVAVRVLARATFTDGSQPAQQPIPQTVQLAVRLPVLASLPGALFPGC